MNAKKIIDREYLIKEQELQNPNISIHKYSYQPATDSYYIQNKSVRRVISPELDIFSDLPSFVFQNDDAKLFLDELRRRISEYERGGLRGVNLSKLRVTENTAVTLVIEWIFNCFRLYFSFDKQEGCFFGEVSNDVENGIFHNDFKKMEREDFPVVANAEVDYAIMMIGGV